MSDVDHEKESDVIVVDELDDDDDDDVNVDVEDDDENEEDVDDEKCFLAFFFFFFAFTFLDKVVSLLFLTKFVGPKIIGVFFGLSKELSPPPPIPWSFTTLPWSKFVILVRSVIEGYSKVVKSIVFVDLFRLCP